MHRSELVAYLPCNSPRFPPPSLSVSLTLCLCCNLCPQCSMPGETHQEAAERGQIRLFLPGQFAKIKSINPSSESPRKFIWLIKENTASEIDQTISATFYSPFLLSFQLWSNLPRSAVNGLSCFPSSRPS